MSQSYSYKVSGNDLGRGAGDGRGGGRDAAVLLAALVATFGVLSISALVAVVAIGAFLSSSEGAASEGAAVPAAPIPVSRPQTPVAAAPRRPWQEPSSPLELSTLEGDGLVDLASLEGTTPFLLAIWLPGCADCVPHLRDLEHLFASSRERGATAWAVAFGGTAPRVRPDIELAGGGLGPHVLLDTDGRLTNGLGVQSFTVFVFDAEGQQRFRGGPPFTAALDVLDECLAEQAEAPELPVEAVELPAEAADEQD